MGSVDLHFLGPGTVAVGVDTSTSGIHRALDDVHCSALDIDTSARESSTCRINTCYRPSLQARRTTMETPITLKPTTAKPVPVRPRPDLRGWVGEYIPGKGGDANLMIMFHGLGELQPQFCL